ncbi:MAG: sulfite oxidase [Planctomycetia bacterium]|nr:sulfite oxidase [Planctomycetia bacterium]
MNHCSIDPTNDGYANAIVDRRVFLQGATAAIAGAVLAPSGQSSAAPAAGAEMLIAGKDPRLIVHIPKPAVFETPAELLAGARVTPTPLLFVRNNQEPSEAITMKPLPLAGWKIELAGLIDGPQAIDAAALNGMEQVEREMVLQCSGNGRSLFANTKGTQWGRGGMGNVRFGGVRLSAILERHGIKIKPEAKYLTAEGKDEPAPGEQDFEHSIPVDEALQKSLLALRLGGEPLPAIHGGPVRLVTPGYYGTMHVKWVTRLRFDSKESDHSSQIPHYRTPRVPIKPGEAFTATYENSEPNWPMKIKCVVLSPASGAALPAGEVPVTGAAFNDGEARIETVLVSIDQGRTWRRAQLEVPDSPYAWYRWTARVRVSPMTKQIWARAIDALGRSQPLDGAIHWNPSGYTWNGVEKIDVKVRV